ncbi:MAG: glycoside hydrolase family 18 protein [Tannerella sp.]|nr:glycoside hydrolase family 18 protein [Tannerella sp.]
MNRIKIYSILLFSFVLCMSCSGNTSKQDNGTKQQQAEIKANEKVIIVYVTSWSQTIPDANYMTHINYAFGHVKETFDGIRIDNEERLKQIVELKKDRPSLKILLSIGGWGSGRFSEMAADPVNRKKFAGDCLRIIKAFDLDGIDIDWEYPTSSMAKISSSPDDTDHFTLLMKDIRESIGKDKLLTLASASSAGYINFKAINPFIDFVNIMAYDMASAPLHHSPLYASDKCGGNTSDDAVRKHHEAGVPLNKLVLGMPFYGRGGMGGIPDFIDYKDIEKLSGYIPKWDEKAQAPYLADSTGIFVCGYDTPRSLAVKCNYIIEKGLLGAMYWDYDGDNETGDLRKAVYETIIY